MKIEKFSNYEQMKHRMQEVFASHNMPKIAETWQLERHDSSLWEEFNPSLNLLCDTNSLKFMHYETLMFLLAHLSGRIEEECFRISGKVPAQAETNMAASIFSTMSRVSRQAPKSQLKKNPRQIAQLRFAGGSIFTEVPVLL